MTTRLESYNFPSYTYFVFRLMICYTVNIVYICVFMICSTSYCFCDTHVMWVHGILSMYVCTWCVQVLRPPKEEFAAAMQLWPEHCEKCVCLQGDYVEKLLHFQLPVVSSFF